MIPDNIVHSCSGLYWIKVKVNFSINVMSQCKTSQYIYYNQENHEM